jgi:DNA mismatch endonuclease (patch repair protein)
MPAKRSTNFKKRSSRQRFAKAPSYTGLEPASRSASRVKSRNRSENTRAELQLRKALSSLGLRYRLHVARLPGRPDVVFIRSRVAVFCDGDFWHGRNWRTRRARLKAGSNATYWINKIRYNMARDKRQTRELEAAGWSIMRLWETDILRNPLTSAKVVHRLVQNRLRPHEG